MTPSRKRQKVSKACQRCRQRKLGCDQTRPCLLCVRAGAECIPRHSETQEDVSATPSVQVEDGSRNDESRTGASGAAAVLPESNIMDLSAMIFSRMARDRNTGYDGSLLPGGKNSAFWQESGGQPWRQLVQCELPSEEVLEKLVDEFLVSVDWFMMVFHKETFRASYRRLLGSTLISYHEQSFLWLAMLVTGLGAHYSSLSPSEDFQGLDLQRLSVSLLTSIELRFLQLVGCPTLETVQICVLLGSFYLFNGRPNAALGILGSGVKIAQVIGLHRESLWTDTSAAIKETKRRTWWALEVFDKYAAIAFGRPSTIDESDCDVAMVSELQDDDVRSGEAEPMLLYHQWKFRLYRIMGPFLGRRIHTNRLETVASIHRQLSRWREDLPQQLRVEAYEADSDTSLYQIAALSLQLTYDNLQIILHRGAAFNSSESSSNRADTMVVRSAFSYQQLFDSAIRTSELYRYSHLLRQCRRTHANMHIGMTLFTAGVVLCAICLPKPMSDVSQKAKTGIRHIIRICRDNSSTTHHLVSAQCVKILEGLVAVILQLENQFITGSSQVPATSSERQRNVHQQSTGDSLATCVNAQPGSASSNYDEAVLDPLQQVFAHHVQQPVTRADSNAGHVSSGGTSSQTPAPAGADGSTAQPLDPIMGFDWNGDLSLLIDYGLGDASQMWLWADNLNYDSFAEFNG